MRLSHIYVMDRPWRPVILRKIACSTGTIMEKTFNRLAEAVSRATGRPWAFALCVASVVVWATCGPIFDYSETWQLVINTGTTIVTFLMVFLIQNTQNRDGAAIQAKLDELIRSGAGKNQFIGIEHLTEKEVEKFRLMCAEAAKAHHAKTGKPKSNRSAAKPARQD
jgi:low affinity Fe/Cu permease